MILFINACVREESRTRKLAEYLLDRLYQKEREPVKELRLEEVAFPKANAEFLRTRDRLLAESRFDDPLFDLARQFAAADQIVIAAPFWDLSFPAALKQYLEQINVVGITFRYTEEGIPVGLCRAKKLYYVMTAGGPVYSDAYGYGYVKALAETFYGISEISLIKAENLDIIGANVPAILAEAEAQIRGIQ